MLHIWMYRPPQEEKPLQWSQWHLTQSQLKLGWKAALKTMEWEQDYRKDRGDWEGEKRWRGQTNILERRETAEKSKGAWAWCVLLIHGQCRDGEREREIPCSLSTHWSFSLRHQRSLSLLEYNPSSCCGGAGGAGWRDRMKRGMEQSKRDTLEAELALILSWPSLCPQSFCSLL